MVDNTNPTNQFHPYQPVDAEPQTGVNSSSTSGISGMLGKLGLNANSLNGLKKNINMSSVRSTATGRNGGMVLGGLAALAIGAGLLRKRSSGRGTY